MICSRTVVGGLIALLATGCSSDDSPADASRDADADALADVRDASADARGNADAQADAGPVEWRVIPGLPPECPIEIALQPEQAVPPLTLVPCPDRPEGCHQVSIDWEVDDKPTFRVYSGFHDGTRGYFSYWRGTDSLYRTYVIGRDDGAIVAVVRAPRIDRETLDCAPSQIMLGGAICPRSDPLGKPESLTRRDLCGGLSGLPDRVHSRRGHARP